MSSPRKKLKMNIDILMTVLLFILMAYHYTGQMWHEITGTAMFVLFICHHLLNREWYKAIGKGKYNVWRILLTVMDSLLLIDILLLMISGISMSSYVFRYLPLGLSSSLARQIHMIAAYLGFLLMSFHIGLHMGGVSGKLWRRIGKFAQRNKAFGFLRGISVVVIILVCIYGIHALSVRNFPGYISGSMMFAYFDYSEMPVLFFLDYVAILFLMVILAYVIQKIVKGGLKGMAGKIRNHISNHKKRYLIILGVIVVLVVILFYLFIRCGGGHFLCRCRHFYGKMT